MKRIHIRRHGEKAETLFLTEEGKKQAKKLRTSLHVFHTVISSPRERAVETAQLLTGKNPAIDQRASPPAFTFEQEVRLHQDGDKHLHGIAGVIFDTPEFSDMVVNKGNELVELIQDLLIKLPDDSEALIISHDGTMVAADMILRKVQDTKPSKTYRPLEGFIVYEDGRLEDIFFQ